MSVFLLGRSCTAQPKPEHRYAALERITSALREALGAAPVGPDVQPHALADLDAQLGAGIQGTFGAFRRSADTLRAKLTALEGQMASLIKQHHVLATHIQAVTWDDYRVESFCFELLIILHRLRKTHSTLVALRKRTHTCLFVFFFFFFFFLFFFISSVFFVRLCTFISMSNAHVS